MQVKGNPPQWAIDMIDTACKEYNRGKPGTFSWKQDKHGFNSSGWCRYAKSHNGLQIYDYVILKNGKTKRRPFKGEIHVRAGNNNESNTLTLLHELAHWTAYRTKSRGHTTYFWKRAFDLFKQFGVDMEKAARRSGSYKRQATIVYNKHYKED